MKNYSKKREAILTKIRSTKSHPTAEWVYHALKADIPDLSLGTVYRNIALFKERGDIVSIGTVGGQERYDGNVLPHGHFVCTACKAVIDFPKANNHPEAAAYLEESGFQVDRIDLIAYGACNQCLKAKI